MATRHTPSAVAQKSHRSEPSAKNDQNEYTTFAVALKKVLSVSHSELKAKLDSEKTKRKRKRASRAGDAWGQTCVSPTLPVTSAKVNRFPAICDKAN